MDFRNYSGFLIEAYISGMELPDTAAEAVVEGLARVVAGLAPEDAPAVGLFLAQPFVLHANGLLTKEVGATLDHADLSMLVALCHNHPYMGW